MFYGRQKNGRMLKLGKWNWKKRQIKKHTLKIVSDKFIAAFNTQAQGLMHPKENNGKNSK
jgi:hypothetical protein